TRAQLLHRPGRGRDRHLDDGHPGHREVLHLPGADRTRQDARGAGMNLIQDRISAATRAAADTVRPDNITPLRLPADHPARVRPGRGWAGWLASAGAAI